MLTALRQRYQLIENRADALLDREIIDNAAWLRALPSSERSPVAWRATARLVAAYRDRWEISEPTPLGRAPDRAGSFAQQADHRRITSAVRSLSSPPETSTSHQPSQVRAGQEL